jgi:hypothetical protein
MSNDRSERRIYRRSPGRQYGYDYNPLRSRNRAETSQEQSSRPDTVSSQRPDPRRTRQLLRQRILAGKRQNANQDELEDIELEEANAETEANVDEYDYDYMESEYDDYDDEVAANYGEKLTYQPSRRPAVTRVVAPPDEDEYYEEEHYVEGEEHEEEEPAPRRTTSKKEKKQKVTRRRLIIGGALVGTAAIAAYELGPKIPNAVNAVGGDIEHQIQDAFNRGLAQGAAAARKDLANALENLEGVSLDSAIAAARLTRVAYDVFVSPIVQFGATLTGNFLAGMAQAMKTARGWLAGAFQDNVTLQAIQKILESWSAQVSNMPKQLNTITDSDLDGAQAYLRALQRKLNEEKGQTNNPATPTPAPTSASGSQQK